MRFGPARFRFRSGLVTAARAPIFAPMCGRFTHRYTWADIHRMYRLTSPASNVQPSYNVCPTDTVNVVTSSQDVRILQPMRWGLIPRWWSKPLKDLMKLSTFNARVETVTTKPFFREAFKRTRCIIPASGYYEWQDTPDGKQPHYFTRVDDQVISFAGLWDEWKDRTTGETVRSCTMIITEPNAMIAEVHDRMPVVLEPDQFTPWLENEAGLEILRPAGEGVLKRWPVSKRVNSSKAPKDDETLTQPVDVEAPQLQV
jgi:putative SOS response-associated peptidase YedK